MQHKHPTQRQRLLRRRERQRVVTGGAAKIVGVTPEMVRNYVKAGRLPFVVNASGHNEYDTEDCERLRDERCARLEKQLAKLRQSVA
jgi:DNA-binding transcriptional MerR regulator